MTNRLEDKEKEIKDLLDQAKGKIKDYFKCMFAVNDVENHEQIFEEFWYTTYNDFHEEVWDNWLLIKKPSKK